MLRLLVFAGAFFEGGPAEWLSSGLRILASQLPEQMLDDGGHFERSPMYHSLILEDVLDLINLHRTWPDLLPDWSDVAGRMLGWLREHDASGRPNRVLSTTRHSASRPRSMLLPTTRERLAIKPDDSRWGTAVTSDWKMITLLCFLMRLRLGQTTNRAMLMPIRSLLNSLITESV
jgi:hypothetical protein